MAEAGLAPARYARVLQADDRTPLLQVVKTCVAASLAWVVCLAILPGQLPVFGAIAAILVVQPSVNQSFAKGLERTQGGWAPKAVRKTSELMQMAAIGRPQDLGQLPKEQVNLEFAWQRPASSK